MNKREEFLKLLENNPIIERYKKLEAVINKDNELKNKIQNLKNIQKQLVNAKEYNKHKMIEMYENKYDMLYNEISEIPLLSEYLALQSDINELLQDVQEIIQVGIETSFFE